MSEVPIRRPDIDFATARLPDLHEVLAELRAVEPVSRILFAGKPTWLLNDYATVSEHVSSDAVLSAPAAYEPLSLTTVGRVLPTMRRSDGRWNAGSSTTAAPPGCSIAHLCGPSPATERRPWTASR